MTENGEQGAATICTRSPSASPASRSVSARIVVEVLDERVRRQPAVRLAEIHRAARRDEPQPQLAGGLQLGLDETRHASREDVVVVEHRRAARESQLRQARARSRVLHLVVEPGPHRIQRLQPGEEVGILRTGPREALVEVMVGVDEPGRDDRAVQVLSGPRRSPLPAATTRPSSICSQPERCSVPASSIVTTQQLVRISDRQRDELEPVDVDEAAVGQLQAGDHREREEREVLERRIERAAERARGLDDRRATAATTSSSGASESSPATGSGSSASTSATVDHHDPAATVREPPHGRRHRRVVHPDDDDVVRVVGDRRRERSPLQAEAAHEPEPRPARAEVPLDDGDLRQVAPGVGDRLAVRARSARRRASR